MKKNIIVVGAGINGLMLATLLAKTGHAVKILESTNQIGGQFLGIRSKGMRYDHGLYIPQLTGHKNVDEIYLKQDVVTRSLHFKDIAGNIFKEILNTNSLFLDLRNHKEINSKIFCEITKNIVNQYKGNSLNNYFKSRFGETAYKNFFHDLIQNTLFTNQKDFDKAILKVFHLSRLVLFDEKISENLKSFSFFDSMIGFPNQMKIPNHFLSDKTPSVYPKSYGLYNLIDGIKEDLDKLNVEIILGIKIKKIKFGKNSHIIFENKQEYKLQFDDLLWCGNTYAIDKLLGINLSIAKKLEMPIKQSVSFIQTSEKPKVKNIYWLWDYDKNPIMRLSFPHNYTKLPFKNKYLIVAEHSFNTNCDYIRKYLYDRKIIPNGSYLQIDNPNNSVRYYYNFSKVNVRLDREFLKLFEHIKPKNFHLCSTKVSKGVFYLHDLLADSVSELQKNGVL